MRFLVVLLLLIPMSSHANFIFGYGLNYSSLAETSDTEYESSRTFHDIFLGASVNSRKTVFFGWNINSWSTSLSFDGGDEETYSVTEMGPRILWYFNDTYNWYMTGEWNPYATGTRNKNGEEGEITGSSTSFGLGYRFKLSRLVGLGAGLHYQSFAMKAEVIDDAKEDVTDKVTNFMPMLELTIITR